AATAAVRRGRRGDGVAPFAVEVAVVHGVRTPQTDEVAVLEALGIERSHRRTVRRSRRERLRMLGRAPERDQVAADTVEEAEQADESFGVRQGLLHGSRGAPEAL